MSKPRILICSDVPQWAWFRKSINIKKHLSDEFDITICNWITDGISDLAKSFPNQDLYMTYSVKNDLKRMMNVPIEKRISGVTVWYPDMEKVLQNASKHIKHITANNIILYNKVSDSGLFENTYYTPNGVDPDIFKPLNKNNNSKFVVGFVGKNTPWKNFESIIKPAFNKANKGNMILLAHQNRYRNAISQEEMIKIYNQMHAYIMASGREEGTPNPILEASACGIPIVGSKFGNMPELVTNTVNGFLCDLRIERYVWCINYLADRKEECLEMGRNARLEILNKWSWKIQAENYRKTFRKVLSRA